MIIFAVYFLERTQSAFFLLSAVWKMEIVLVNFLTVFNTHTILTDIILYQSQNTQLTVKQVDCLFLRRGRFKQL